MLAHTTPGHVTDLIGRFQVTQLTDKLKNQSESNKQAQDNLHKEVQEQKGLLRASQDRAQALESALGETQAQLAQSREKLAQLDTQVEGRGLLLFNQHTHDLNTHTLLEHT